MTILFTVSTLAWSTGDVFQVARKDGNQEEVVIARNRNAWDAQEFAWEQVQRLEARGRSASIVVDMRG
jgi:hypothetical protein|tara:strand:+ start:305 stop:508 length:204 start_codon:yes stop_codon:yes gene_type:complete